MRNVFSPFLVVLQAAILANEQLLNIKVYCRDTAQHETEDGVRL